MSIKQRFLSLGLAAALVIGGSAGALAAPAYADTPLNVRAGPSASAPIVDVLRRGERVDVDYCRGSWCSISKPGPDGWVSARYLARGGGDYYDDGYYDDGPIYIERPRRIIRHHRDYRRPIFRHRDRGPDFSACVGGRNARFCIYD
jgi:uncharacterized protein YraI